MNKFIVLSALCVIMALSYGETKGHEPPGADHFTVPETDIDELPIRTWRVYGAMASHPDDAPLFVVDDIFYLQQGNENSVLFKPLKMKHSHWNSAYQESDDIEENLMGQNALVLRRFSKEDRREYLCGRVKIANEKHLIVISKMTEDSENETNQDRITIEYEHNSNNPWHEQCENVVLPSHGGLAHAHATR